MPEMNGRQLAAAPPRLQPVHKVLYMTGSWPRVLDRKTNQRAHTGRIDKAFTAKKLLPAVRDLLDAEVYTRA